MKKWGWAAVLVLSATLAQAQNENNGEQLSRFVTSEAFAQMTPEQLKPIQKKTQAHLDRCVAATVKHLQQRPENNGVTAKQLQKHYQMWVPYYKSTCEIYAAEQESEPAAREALKMRCQVFSQSSFYSNLLAYQHHEIAECQ